VFQIGQAIVQVSQARQPCWRLNLRFGVADMSAQLQASLKTGWYYRPLSLGRIQAGDKITLIERPQPDWPLSRLLSIFYQDTLNYCALETIAALPELAASWRAIAQQRLVNRKVEDWQQRLQGL
jgi:MOSC domain-containing protein YiiM